MAQDDMTPKELEGALRRLASLADAEEELPWRLRRKLLHISHAQRTPSPGAWQTSLALACFVTSGVNLIGAPLATGSFFLLSALLAGVYGFRIRGAS